MLSKIYYCLGIGIIALYLLINLLSLRTGGAAQTRPLGVMRMNKGKYVYVAPTYSSSSPNGRSSSSDDSSGGRYRSYPSGGGYSGGK